MKAVFPCGQFEIARSVSFLTGHPMSQFAGRLIGAGGRLGCALSGHLGQRGHLSLASTAGAGTSGLGRAAGWQGSGFRPRWLGLHSIQARLLTSDSQNSSQASFRLQTQGRGSNNYRAGGHEQVGATAAALPNETAGASQQYQTALPAVVEPEERSDSNLFQQQEGQELETNLPLAVGDDGAFGSMQAAVVKALEQALGSPLGREPQTPPPKPLVIVISGPSGVGKDAVIKRLQEVRQDLHFVVTATTRLQRPGEVHGQDYFFMTKEEFGEMIQENELLEHAVVYGDYKGIPKKQVRDAMVRGTDVVLRVDVQGAATVRSILGDNALFIFLVAESEVALVKRLVERKTESMEKVLVRITTARDELKRLHEFDYVVVNSHGQLEKAVQTLCSIIDAEKAKVRPRVAVL